MKIVVTGTRGIPGIQGGVETHCMELYPKIADRDHEIIVVRRPEYLEPSQRVLEYKGVKIKDITSTKNKYTEALFHTFKAIIYARKINADILHVHAVGPSLMVPFARILGLKVVMTHHGEDYNRKKWGRVAKSLLCLGEKMGVLYANHVIVISDSILNMIRLKFPKQTNLTLIHNGVNKPVLPKEIDYLTAIGIEPKKYILAVGRLVEEKGFDLLIEAFNTINNPSVKLVIAGAADHDSPYSRKLKTMAKSGNVIFTGFVTGDKLSQLYTHNSLFVLPSFHEGLPIALLEAMSYGCNILASNIAPNQYVGLPVDDYFICGDVTSLYQGLLRKYSENNSICTYDLSLYDWKIIAQKTKKIYDDL